MCFALIVGKKASADGSVLFGHNEQNFGLNVIHYRKIPRMANHRPPLNGTTTLPAITETAAFLWTETPGMEFSDGCFNEWGVAIAGDGCPTREDEIETMTARGDISEGGVGYMLPRLLAMQARTARGAVDLAAALIGRYGYTGSGRSLTIADANEAWVLSLARGKRWLARRVPDDAVVAIPNAHVIGEDTDLTDTENVIASPGLVEYVASRGWHDAASGRPFSFRAAFNIGGVEGTMCHQHGCDARQWLAHGLLTGTFPPLPPTGELPFAVKPQRKLTVADVAAIMRAHLEDTDHDHRRDNPAGSPHHSEETLDYSFARELCNIATQESAIYQLRSWLPREIGCVVWRTTSVPCTGVYTPWYSGISETPASYYYPCSIEEQLDLAHHFTPAPQVHARDGRAFWAFHELAHVMDRSWAKAYETVRPVWAAFEAQGFALQEAVERTALDLHGRDPALLTAYLTDYTAAKALQATDTARGLVRRLLQEGC